MNVVRLPNKSPKQDPKLTEYFPRINCLGSYWKTYLWRHKKKCKSNVTSKITRFHLSKSQTIWVITGMLGNYLNNSRMKKEVFSIMRPENISYTAKTDCLICLFGESYMNKRKRKQMNTVVSNKMRKLAR